MTSSWCDDPAFEGSVAVGRIQGIRRKDIYPIIAWLALRKHAFRLTTNPAPLGPEHVAHHSENQGFEGTGNLHHEPDSYPLQASARAMNDSSAMITAIRRRKDYAVP